MTVSFSWLLLVFKVFGLFQTPCNYVLCLVIDQYLYGTCKQQAWIFSFEILQLYLILIALNTYSTFCCFGPDLKVLTINFILWTVQGHPKSLSVYSYPTDPTSWKFAQLKKRRLKSLCYNSKIMYQGKAV